MKLRVNSKQTPRKCTPRAALKIHLIQFSLQLLYHTLPKICNYIFLSDLPPFYRQKNEKLPLYKSGFMYYDVYVCKCNRLLCCKKQVNQN